MDSILKEFDAKFQIRPELAAVTYYRDVEPAYVDQHLDGIEREKRKLIPWGMQVPNNPTEQQLNAIALKWAMAIDEMFYIGDVAPFGEFKSVLGLINDPRFADSNGSAHLVEPVMFGKMAMEGKLGENVFPCKWLQMVRSTEFHYNKDKLLFRLCWPKLVPGVREGDPYTYIGGIAPARAQGSS